VIEDTAIFGLSRTGKIDGSLEYPMLIDTQNSSLFSRDGNRLRLYGHKFSFPATINPDNSEPYVLDSSGEIAMIPDAPLLLQRPPRLVERIFTLRDLIGYRPLIYMPGIGDPYIIPSLVYLGVSIFDDLFVRARSMEGYLFTPLGMKKTSGPSVEENISFTRNIVEITRHATRNGTLREIVEKFLISGKAVETVRAADTHFYAEMEKLYPVRTPYVKVNTVMGLERPDLRRYRERVLSRYRKLNGKPVLLILPCTAKKPYFLSATHKRVLSAIRNYRRFFHKLVVTSPVGIVPEELEEVYPVSYYDIPTIGQWFEDEKIMIERMLTEYLKVNPYGEVVAYVSPDLDFIQDSLPENSHFIMGDIRSSSLLEELKSLFRNVIAPQFRPENQDQRMTRLKSIASFQFGTWILDHLNEMKPVRNYNQEILMRGNSAMLSYNAHMGKFTISKKMGKIFADEGRFTVYIDDFQPTANIYAMGVMDVTSDIRQEDEVVIVHDGEVRGVGIAKMHARAMKELNKGIAVKVRN